MTRRPARYSALALALPGILLALVAMAGVLGVAMFDAARSERYHSLLELLAPDASAAAWTMALVGASEGVAIAAVIVVAVLAVQLTAGRYSPRIIDIFACDPLNWLVPAFFLGSILFTIGVAAEIKPDYVPAAGVLVAMVLAVFGFAILLPYVRYTSSVMRPDAIVRRIRRRAAGALKEAAAEGRDVACRHLLRDCLAQITDIALASVQKGDAQICLAAIEALREIVVDDYVPVKAQLPSWWFVVGHEDMPGASDQTMAQVDRTRTWVEHTVLAYFLDLLGETPAYRKEVVHAIARTTRELGEAGIKYSDGDLEDLVVRFFNTYLRAAMDQRAPTFAYSTMNEYRNLAARALDARPHLISRVSEHLIAYGRSFDAAGFPLVIGTAAEDVAELTIQTARHDPERALPLCQLLDRTLTAMANTAQPLALNAVLTAVVKLALWAMSEHQKEIADRLLAGVSALPEQFVDEALSRMERTTEGVFWEVSDRVVAFDWVEEDLRELIPALRRRLRAPVSAPARRPRRQLAATS
jgi:hypothetical protein